MSMHNDEGFTLVEMLVVVIVIGILSAIALPSFLNQANKAREAEAAGNVGVINRAQQAHYVEKSEFGSDLDSLDLGIGNTQNYEYEIKLEGEGTEMNAIATASPAGQLKGYAGRVWLEPSTNGNTTRAINCPGVAGEVPDLSSATLCP